MDGAQQTRTRSIWLWQLALAAVVVVLVLAILALVPDMLTDPTTAVGAVLILALTVASLLVPWHRAGPGAVSAAERSAADGGDRWERATA